VVHHHVEEDADALRVGRVDHLAQFLGGAHRLVEGGEVERVVAVVGVVLELLVATHHPAVDLLVRRGDPDGVDAEFLEPALLELVRHAFQVTAVERADLVLAVFLPPVGVVVRRVAVLEAVGDQEIDDRVVLEAARHGGRGLRGGRGLGHGQRLLHGSGGGTRRGQHRQHGGGDEPQGGAEIHGVSFPSVDQLQGLASRAFLASSSDV